MAKGGPGASTEQEAGLLLDIREGKIMDLRTGGQRGIARRVTCVFGAK